MNMRKQLQKMLPKTVHEFQAWWEEDIEWVTFHTMEGELPSEKLVRERINNFRRYHSNKGKYFKTKDIRLVSKVIESKIVRIATYN